jgi:hypothetical protein
VGRLLKCKQCGVKDVEYKDRFDKMEIESSLTSDGKTRNLYFHKGECWEERLKYKAFLEKEKKDMDDLNLTIKKIHRRKSEIPVDHYVKIQDLRNGTARYRKFWEKKKKEGVPYKVIEEAYRMSKDKIEYARSAGKFRDTNHELAYSFKIVLGKIEDAYKKLSKNEDAEKRAKGMEKHIVEDIKNDNGYSYKKQKDKYDMSDIFGDD